MNSSEKILFFRKLSLYLKAGVPITQALSFITEDSKSRKAKAVFSEIERLIATGQTISSSLLNFPKEFDRFSVGFIHAGEITGNLADSFGELAIVLYRREQLRKKILNALAYPVLILCATFCVTIFLVIYVFPKILPVLKGLKTDLPFSTRVLILLSEFLKNYWWLVLIVFGLVTAISVLSLQRTVARKNIERILLKTPYLCRFFQYYSVVIFSRTLSIQLNAGVQITSALDLTRKTLPGTLYPEAANTIQNQIMRGRRLSDTLRDQPLYFPIMVCQMVAVGEATGTLALNLRTLADLYEEYLDDVSRILTTLIEPILMVCVGCVVGFIAMAIISPIYEMTQNLNIQ